MKSINSTSSEKNAVDLMSELSYNEVGIANVLLDEATTKKYIEIFDDKIRRPVFDILNDKISKSVWLDKQAILLLADYLNKPELNLDGVRLHFIAYEQKETAPGQYKENQTSVAIVLTNPLEGEPQPGKSEHIDNWDLLNPERAKALSKVHSLNHGQLCPTICP